MYHLSSYLSIIMYQCTYLSTYIPVVCLGEWIESPNYYHCLPLRVRMEYTDSKVQRRTLTFYFTHFCTVKILIGCFVTKKIIKITNCNSNYPSDSPLQHLTKCPERVNTENSRCLRWGQIPDLANEGGVRSEKKQKVRGEERRGLAAQF